MTENNFAFLIRQKKQFQESDFFSWLVSSMIKRITLHGNDQFFAL